MRAPGLVFGTLTLVLAIAACRERWREGEWTRAEEERGPGGGGARASSEAGASFFGHAGHDASEDGGNGGGAERTRGRANEPPDSDPHDAGLPEPEPEPKPEPEPEPEPEPGAGGLPCEVQALLQARCHGCHSHSPAPGALHSLVTYADLMAPSVHDPSLTVAASSAQRMGDSARPMPPAPAPAVTSAELSTFRAWLAAGSPRVECDGVDPNEPSSDPYDAPATCSSERYWAGFDSGSPWMLPGHACIACHRGTNNRAPRFTLAGTVFATAHEPDKCHGVPAALGAQVIITDANGQELPPIRLTAGGNFGVIAAGLALPYRAKIVVGGRERVMLTPQTNGDCNACHTQAGAHGARGRIIVP